MTIDFRAEVDKRKDALMEDLFGLLRINSERNDSKVDDKHPFGPGPVKALEHFLALAERDGYKTRNIDNYAGDFEFGQGDEVLGIFAHLDVVPAGSGWDALKIIKELELPVSKRVRFIVGTDEESGWGDMEYYFAHNGLKDPDFGFSPDAEFPIINGEKGNITAYLHFEGQNDGDFSLESFNGGLRENMVPESASADFTGPITLKELEAKLADFVAEQEVTGQVTEEAGVFHVTIHGKSAHGMMPQNGINGATYLALFLSQFDFQGNAKTYLDIIAETLHKDFFAEKTGLAYTDPKMGELTMNAGVFNFSKESEDNTIALNFRYPQGVDTDAIKANLEKLEGPKAVSLSEHGHVPHYVPVDDPMVETLLSVYEKQTGLKGHEQIIGGGTFGRLLKRGVAYGAMFPGYVNTMHQANEFTEVEDLYRAAAIYAEAIYELIK